MILNTKVLIKLFIAVTKRKYRDRQTYMYIQRDKQIDREKDR